MNKKSVITVFADMATAMSSMPFSEALAVVARAGTEIAGSFRCCIVLKNRKDELKIKAEFPHAAYGIGEKVTGSGEKHLRKIMEEYEHVFIDDPTNNPATAYMQNLAKHWGIASVFFVPLLSEKEAVGVMI